jgi:hypothetical protein
LIPFDGSEMDENAMEWIARFQIEDQSEPDRLMPVPPLLSSSLIFPSPVLVVSVLVPLLSLFSPVDFSSILLPSPPFSHNFEMLDFADDQFHQLLMVHSDKYVDDKWLKYIRRDRMDSIPFQHDK